MDRTARNELIDAYFEGMDERDRDALDAALADDVVYHHPVETVTGREAALEFIIDERPTQESIHDVSRRVHVPGVSVAEGRKVGTVEGEPVDLPFCDVFEFEDGDSAITSIAIYVRE